MCRPSAWVFGIHRPRTLHLMGPVTSGIGEQMLNVKWWSRGK